MPPFHVATHREREPEVMDDPGLDAGRHEAALHALSRINLLSASARILWRPIAQLAAELDTRRLRVLDIATGGGDIPLRLWRKARQAGIELELTGVDISPVALDFARRRSAELGADIEFQQVNVLQDELPGRYDVVTASLFLHHLDDEQAALLLRKMAAATQHLVLVNDLLRKNWGLWLAHLAGRLFTRSDVVQTDGPLSVRAAFTLDEARRAAEAAGLSGATLSRRWPCRFLLAWRRSA